MNIETRVEELETKLAFQDMTIEELNQEVVKLNQLVGEQQQTMQLLIGKLKDMEPSNMASPSEETPPPHY
ncbi:SlyX family protein [Shewanella gelidii]|uniref:Protein SlyX homolog n=1 Tax=Shewanella gelidii TaxID=1642821 RepID=A0A917N8W4_9GAMM|nr:SlyX family protein [Shewanella gelidii]GGI77588.1 protein SlyX [Shewanella gelidii]